MVDALERMETVVLPVEKHSEYQISIGLEVLLVKYVAGLYIKVTSGSIARAPICSS